MFHLFVVCGETISAFFSSTELRYGFFFRSVLSKLMSVLIYRHILPGNMQQHVNEQLAQGVEQLASREWNLLIAGTEPQPLGHRATHTKSTESNIKRTEKDGKRY